MNGAIPPLPLHALMALAVATLSFTGQSVQGSIRWEDGRRLH